MILNAPEFASTQSLILVFGMWKDTDNWWPPTNTATRESFAKLTTLSTFVNKMSEDL